MNWKSAEKVLFCSLFLFVCLQLAGEEKGTGGLFARRIDVPYAPRVPHKADFTLPVWKKTPRHPLLLFPRTVDEIHRYPRERGSVQFLYDENFFYAAFTLTDSDIVTESTAHHRHHYQYGDVVELFLKSDKAPCFWEIYGTPNSLMTCFFYPSRSHSGLAGYPEVIRETKIRAAARIRGTLNKVFDKDRGYQVLLIVPLRELEKKGVPFKDSSHWRVAVGRYNYALDFPELEFSCFPQLEGVFCDTERFARMRLLPPQQEKRK